MHSRTETIAAAATPPGPSALGVVRLSGPDSIKIADTLFRTRKSARKPSELPSRTCHVGSIVDSGEIIDSAVICTMKAPLSYTGEDMVELSCHGSMLIISRLLQLCRLAGAAYAEPGEFTKRAFLNGKMDLTQAEAVNSLIRARTEGARKQAISLISGDMSRAIEKIRDMLEETKGLVDADIEWGEEQKIEFIEQNGASVRLKKIICETDRLVEQSYPAESAIEGYRVVICGLPNAGKSSLFNSLLKLSRSITSRIPGTTRDVIESETVIDGCLVRFVDTAGIGLESSKEIDKISAYRSIDAIKSADLAVYVIDGSSGIGKKDYEIRDKLEGVNWIAVVNKTDLKPKIDNNTLKDFCAGKEKVSVSCKRKRGISKLAKYIIKELGAGYAGRLMVSARQKDLLEKLSGSFESAAAEIENGRSELISFELGCALDILGKIDGKVIEENILDRVFENFCIGK